MLYNSFICSTYEWYNFCGYFLIIVFHDMIQ